MAKTVDKLFIPNRWKWIFLLFGIILIPHFFAIIYFSELSNSLTFKLAYIALILVLISLPAIFLKAKHYFLFEGIFVLLSPFDIAHFILNKAPITLGFVSALLQTNYAEATEVLASFKIAIILTICIWILYYYSITKIENNYFFTTRTRVTIACCIILFNGALYATMWPLAENDGSLKNHISIANAIFLKKYRKVFPYDFLSSTIGFIQLNNEVRKMDKVISKFHFNIRPRNIIKQRQIYVLVIGESAKYENFSINGYHRETSPRLKEVTNLATFNNVYANANLTEAALTMILTRATPQNNIIAYKEKSVCEAFAEAGFYTSWIANQSASNPFIRRITNKLNYSFFSKTDFDAPTNFDGNLIEQVAKVLNKKEQKIFIVIHTLGSHFKYNSRYPQDFKLFKPGIEDDSKSLITKMNKVQLINSYDNSILYTDYVLSQIIKLLDKENAVSAFLYLSDHAENLYDNNSNLILHGQSHPTKKELHIPLFVWTSKKYQLTFQHKESEIKRNKNKSISSSNIFHTLIDLANLTYPSENLNKSFASPQFKENGIKQVLTPENVVTSYE